MGRRTVAVVDYGMGNLRSVSQAVMHVARGTEVEVVVTSKPDEVYAAERIVLPGQGAMPDCMRELRDSGSAVTSTCACGATCSSAFDTERRLPIP